MKAKKFCIIALVLAIVLLIAPISESWAEEELDVKTSGDYEYYILDDGTACIKKYNGNDEKVIIPKELDGIRITDINIAFSYCKNITEITIPDGVKSIGDAAFAFCKNLTEITIPDSVEIIEDNPFFGCENLLNINISANNPTLEFVDNALIYKSEKKIIYYLSTSKESKYEIPYGIESIGNNAFYNCYNLTEIKIPDSVQFIGHGAFSTCTNLTEIKISDGVKEIEDSAFYLCKNMKKINIPASVDMIGDNTFEDCNNLTATVARDSYAEKYCITNNIKYMYEDSLKN